MITYDYAIAVGSDQTALTNVQSIVTYAPKGKPIPLGSVRRVTLNQHTQTNGTKVLTWSWGAMSWADFLALITFIFGGFDNDSEDVTIDTRARSEIFERGNAVAILPIEGEDYQRREHGDVEDLVITFRDFQPVTGGNGFSLGFSLGFES